MKLNMPILATIFLVGCSAAFVPASSDPETKLNQAVVLFQEQNRPLPADRIIHDAMEIYREKGDDLGLADAQKVYGSYLQSPSVERYYKYFREHGFIDRSVTYENRNEKAREYFLKARETFEKKQKYDSLTNVDLALGHHYLLIAKDLTTACLYYNKSLEDNRKFKEVSPNSPVETLKGFKSYEDYVAEVKRQTGCK